MKKNIHLYFSFPLIFLLHSFSLIEIINSKGVFLPFKTVLVTEPSSFKPSDVLNVWGQSRIYTSLKIGTPYRNIKAFLSTSSYETFLFEHMCKLSDSSYDRSESSSYNFITDINYLFNKQIKSKIINETIQLFSDMSQTKSFDLKGMNMIYSENKEEDFKESGGKESYINLENTCLNIGFEPKYPIGYGYELGLVTQLKRRDIITSYDFTIKYNEDNKNSNEGYLVIGSKPHEFASQYYYSDQYVLTGALNKDFISDWTLDFDKVYYSGKKPSNEEKIEKKLLSSQSIRINIDIGIIYGTSSYEKAIKEDFFDYLISNGQCFVDESDNIRTYYCNKDIYGTIIKNCFPTLTFEMKQLSATFELNYKDLFREKNDYVYFLMVFGKLNNYDSFFEMGKLFLKKYLLTFNYDSKMIGFYNRNIPTEERRGENEGNNNKNRGGVVWKIALIIVLGGALIGLGFLLGKKVYDTVRKKRANELNDEYDYNTAGNIKGEEEEQNTPITDDNGQ